VPALVVGGSSSADALVPAAVVRSASLAPATSSAWHYAFLGLQPDGWNPIRWNPCVRAITYKINLDGAPASQLPALRAAVATVAAATHLPLRYAGTTTVIPTLANIRSGALTTLAHASLVIAFARPGTGPGRSTLLHADGRAWGGVSWRTYSAPVAYSRVVSGYVVIPMTLLRYPKTVLRAIYLHELGHAVGLGHVTDRTQLMNATVLVYSFGSGDMAGLAHVGAYTGCLPPE
jgi:hypothetical protein